MRTADTTTRTAVIAGLLAALGGCHLGRHRDDTAAATDVAKPVTGKTAKPVRENLPPGLAGDTAHKAYTGAPN